MKTILVISDRDNVGTALESIDAGQPLTVGDRTIVARQPIPRGHKVAVLAIAAGEAVVKYGSAIGLATAEIPPGAHVHTHNLSSSRGRGDLGQQAAGGSEARLAEPPDEAGNAADEPAAARRPL